MLELNGDFIGRGGNDAFPDTRRAFLVGPELLADFSSRRPGVTGTSHYPPKYPRQRHSKAPLPEFWTRV